MIILPLATFLMPVVIAAVPKHSKILSCPSASLYFAAGVAMAKFGATIDSKLRLPSYSTC
eukprot:5776437-Amphidinium_carterae.1